jgi:hypothetical protein
LSHDQHASRDFTPYAAPTCENDLTHEITASILALVSGAMRAGIQVEGHAKAVRELWSAFDRYRRGSSACALQPRVCSANGFLVSFPGLSRVLLASGLALTF